MPSPDRNRTSTWERNENTLALLELLDTGQLRRRVTQADVWKVLDEVSWTRRTGRRDEIQLVIEQEHNLLELLDRVWPPWKAARKALAERGLRPTPSHWRLLQDIIRTEHLPEMPERLNRRTALAAVAPHSKSGWTTKRRDALAETITTCDGIVRLRPPRDLQIVRQGECIDATQVSRVLGEVAISERAFLDGTTIQGPVRAVLTVENLGPYQDLTAPDGWLIIHVPGWTLPRSDSFCGSYPVSPSCTLAISTQQGYASFGIFITSTPDYVGSFPTSGQNTLISERCAAPGRISWSSKVPRRSSASSPRAASGSNRRSSQWTEDLRWHFRRPRRRKVDAERPKLHCHGT